MNKLQLFRLLRRHIKLSEKRSLAYEQNKTAKVIMYIFGCFAIAYILFISLGMALIANEVKSYTPYEFMFGMAPYLLILDFAFRFISQRTPVQLIKPYSLLPIPKYTCVELFILSSVVTPNNLLWLVLTVPYAIMTTLFSEGITASIGLILAYQLLVTINSQWYMLVRTMINQSLKWWIIPILVYGAAASLMILIDFDALFNLMARAGEGFTFFNPLHYAALLLVLWGFVELNKRIQYRMTYIENTNAESTKMKSVSEFKILNRYGETGEYLKLEVKSLLRNKNIRKSFLFSTLFIVFLSLIISFTDIYDSGFSKKFWVVYTFVLYGCMMLIKIMSAEGNYIDGLMIHKENIMQLLRAKYIFYSLILIFPLLLMLPTVFMGKYTLLMLLSMAAFTAGPVYFVLMQMAVYNKQTIPLNTKFVSKGNIENNYFQIVAELLAMFFPVGIISALNTLCGETLTFIILLITGTAFILLHKIWIKNIYKRLMARRYKNMESFRATR